MKRFAMISGLVLVASLGMASSAQARSTKQAKASLYHFTEAAHYITGKATPGRPSRCHAKSLFMPWEKPAITVV